MQLRSHNTPGAVFRRCALQVNPAGYGHTFRGGKRHSDARAHAAAIVEKARDLGIAVLAITNHNDASDVSHFEEAAKGRGITIFPGFELASQEGIHVLCIYPQRTTEEQMARFLGEFGIRETKASADLAEMSFVDILRKAREQGGIAIAAHVTNDKGLFKVLNGQPRIKAWRSPDLLAIQIPGKVEDLHPSDQEIVINKNPGYRREHPVGEELAVAVVNASDVTEPTDLESPSATCWIKMSKASIEALRQAFMDPESRIRLCDDTDTTRSGPQAEIVSVGWEGGFLNGAEVYFSPNLNVLIGGRGTGKSTIIESIRYVLGLDPAGEQATVSHRGIVQHVLRSGTKVSLKVRIHQPVLREYVIERTVPNRAVVRNENGEPSNLRPEEILAGVEVYGQHEIAELARSPEKLTLLLDRFLPKDNSPAQRKADLRSGSEDARTKILDVSAEIDHINDRLESLPGLDEQIARFGEAGFEDLLRERSLLLREEGLIEAVRERVRPFAESVDQLRENLPIDRAFVSPEALADLPGGEILRASDELLESLSNHMGRLLAELDETLHRADESIENLHSRWKVRKRQVTADYERTLRELGEGANAAAEFIDAQKRLEQLRPLRERLPGLEKIKEGHIRRRQALLKERQEVTAEEFRLLEIAGEQVNERLKDRVQVAITKHGDRTPLLDLLRDQVGGRLAETIEVLESTRNFSLTAFVDCCRSGADTIMNKYGIPENQAIRLAKASVDTFMQIEELDLPPTTEIRLNLAPMGGSPSWRAIDELSMGQKATAVLLLLLLDTDSPLIVDQPEDDLDNRFITEGVIPGMRLSKSSRQFVFSTHNANIPVLGDAELIVGLTAKGGADAGGALIEPEHIGSIDTDSVRELVENVLEGGKAAFETRRLKYGFRVEQSEAD